MKSLVSDLLLREFSNILLALAVFLHILFSPFFVGCKGMGAGVVWVLEIEPMLNVFLMWKRCVVRCAVSCLTSAESDFGLVRQNQPSSEDLCLYHRIISKFVE